MHERDLANLAGTIDVLLAPLTFTDCDAWRTTVEERVCELLQGDHVVFALPKDGRFDAHGLNVQPGVIQNLNSLFRGVPDIPADPLLHLAEEERVRERVQIWSRLRSFWRIARQTGTARRSSFVGEVLDPAVIRDSENIDFTTAAGHTALCVSYVTRGNPRRGGEGAARFAADALLRAILPATKAGVAEVLRLKDLRQRGSGWLLTMTEPAALFDARGRELFRNDALTRELGCDREADRLVSGLRRAACALFAIEARREMPGSTTAEPSVTLTTNRARYRVTALHAPLSAAERYVLVKLRRTTPPSGPSAHCTVADRWGNRLTARETQVATLLARRATNSEIATRMGLSPHTVRHHIESIFHKLGISSRRDLARMEYPL